MSKRTLTCRLLIAAIALLCSCSASKRAYNADRTFPVEKLQQDFRVFRTVLQENHPSLYWYTPKDSVDYYFDLAYSRLNRPMTEVQFKVVLSFVLSSIRCGHTSMRSSKAYSRYLDTAKIPQFPLSIKFWNDSAVIYANLNRRDRILKRGTPIDSIDGKPFAYYRDSIFRFLPMDGFSINHKFQTLSNVGGFSSWYRNVFGPKDKFLISYRDSTNALKDTTIAAFNPRKDSISPAVLLDYKKPDRRGRKTLRLADERSLQIDSSRSAAYLVINSFLRDGHLSNYIRRTFRELKRKKIKHLIVDVRYNGGGNVGISNLLTRYLIDLPFKVADSLYATNRSNNNSKYIQHQFWYWLSMNFITRKRSDGKYHYGYFERHHFHPKKNNHFDGDVYIITGGNSFSATSLFAKFLKGQKNITLVGEETGGGAYGNTAWLIPTVTLPASRLRFTLPRFRMVIDKNAVKDGRGVMPDIFVGATRASIEKGADPKLEMALDLIDQKR